MKDSKKIDRYQPIMAGNKPAMAKSQGLWVHLSDHYKVVKTLEDRIKELETKLDAL